MDDLLEQEVNLCIPWYIMSQYSFEKNHPLISEAAFRRLRRRLLDNWDEIEHKHKGFLTKDSVVDKTYEGEYPSHTDSAIEQLLEAVYGRSKTNAL